YVLPRHRGRWSRSSAARAGVGRRPPLPTVGGRSCRLLGERITKTGEQILNVAPGGVRRAVAEQAGVGVNVVGVIAVHATRIPAAAVELTLPHHATGVQQEDELAKAAVREPEPETAQPALFEPPPSILRLQPAADVGPGGVVEKPKAEHGGIEDRQVVPGR